MKLTSSPQKELETEISKEKEQTITRKIIKTNGFYQHLESRIYAEELDEFCFVLSSN